MKLTMPDMKAIAFALFGGTRLTGDKAAHVAAMEKLNTAQPAILAAYVAPAAVAPAAPSTPEFPEESDVDLDEDSDEELERQLAEHGHLFETDPS